MAEQEPLNKRLKKHDNAPDFLLDVKGVRFSVTRQILQKESALMKQKLLSVPLETNYLEINDENPLCVCKCLCFLERRFVNGGSFIIWPSTSFSSIEEIVDLSDVSPLLDLAYRWEIPSLQKELFSYLHRNLNEKSHSIAKYLSEKYNNLQLLGHCKKFVEQLEERNGQPNFILVVKGVPFSIRREILENESAHMKRKLLTVPIEQSHFVIEDENPLCICKCLCVLEGKCINGGEHIVWPRKSFSLLDEIVQLSDVPSLLDLSNRWEIKKLQEDMFQFLRMHLNIDTFYFINSLEEKNCDAQLQKHCDDFLAKNFCLLCQNQNFLLLKNATIIRALKSSEFKTSCWTLVFESILSWTAKDVQRENSFEDIFGCIDLTNFTPEYLENQIETNRLVCTNAACLLKVHKAYREVYEKSEGVIIPHHLSSQLKIHCPLSKRSLNLEVLDWNRNANVTYSLMMFENNLHAFLSNQSVFRLTLQNFDAKWRKLASTNDYHDEMPCATGLNGCLFVLGGGRVMKNTCEKYCSEDDSWKRVSILNLATESYSVASASGAIYIIGVARDGMQTSSSVEKFCPFDGSLSLISPMNQPISSPSTTALDKCIYAAGSDSFTMNIECLDTGTEMWTSILSCQQDPMHISSIFATQTSLFCFAHQQGCIPGRISLLSIPSSCHHVEVSSLTNLDSPAFDFKTLFCGPLKNYDVIIKVGGKEFPAHRKILSESSSYFRAMFSYEMVENLTSVVAMKDIDSRIVRQCIDFAYNTGCPAFTLEDVEPLLHAASYMHIPDMLQILTTTMIQWLSEVTFQRLKHLSHKYGVFEVEDACDDFASKNFEKITRYTPTCLALMEKEYFVFLLSSRETEANNELQAYESIIRWVRWGNGTRDCHFSELFSNLNLVKIPEVAIRCNIMTEKLVQENVLCKAQVDISLQTRKKLHEVICIICADPGACNSNLIVFSPSLQKWKTIWAKKPAPSYTMHLQGAMVSARDCFYAVVDDTELYKLEYHDVNARWNHVGQINESILENTKTVATDDFIFIVETVTIREYNISRGTWRIIKANIERDGFTIVAAEGHLFIFGGIDVPDGYTSATTQSYDIQSESLDRNLRPMHRSRCDAAAAYLSGKIFITGGLDPEIADTYKNVEFYDISTNLWTILPCMNFCRADHQAFIADGKLFVIGGDENSPNTMECYDEDSQTWDIVVMPKTSLHFALHGRIPFELLF